MVSRFVAVLALFVLTVSGFYRGTDVYELSADNFDELILKSNYTSVVEFYAPWCGHCRNFKAGYIKAGKQLKDLVTVGAVDCDVEANKPLCGKYGIKGFPTVMVFRPAKFSAGNQKQGVHVNEPYNGQRTAQRLVSFVLGRVKNYIKRLFTESKWQKWIADGGLKLALLSDSKNKPSLFLKSLGIDYLGVAEFAYFDFKKDFSRLTVLEGLEVDESKPFFISYYKGEAKVLQGDLTKDKIAKFVFDNYGVGPAEGKGSIKEAFWNLLKKGKTVKKARKQLKKEAEKTGKSEKGEKIKKRVIKDEL